MVHGSFTGLRIGIATVKAFQDSLELPCIGINSLEALAYNLKDNNKTELICSIIDCKNDNCYFALYEKNNDKIIELIKPSSETIESTINILHSYIEDSSTNSHITFIGDGAEVYKKTITNSFENSSFADSNLNVLSSYSLGIAGFEKYNLGEEIQEILPLYLKKPQAQRLLEEKESSQKN